ncbi:MAG: peptide-methionine (R)-S-oxide reductase MsrB [Rhodobacteraceae bacterium]|nr:peptide-methionine (R)-S-oxide reductase MsrB [Paracoccaceae bacterium]
MKRRTFLFTTSAAILSRPAFAVSCDFEICRSEAEWRARLSEAEYLVLREEDTERPYSSPLNDETRPGTYHCRGCDLPLYDAGAKYDSGTGWPSFFESLPDAVGTRTDRRYVFQVRTEVHCRRCGGHLGHIFDDGPEPTGKRHCLNGLSLVFVAAG